MTVQKQVRPQSQRKSREWAIEWCMGSEARGRLPEEKSAEVSVVSGKKPGISSPAIDAYLRECTWDIHILQISANLRELFGTA
jgi:hypothetical protein